jgi:hypothetical protein
MQRQLLHQRIAEIGIVIHDQDFASIGHGYNPIGGAVRWLCAHSRELAKFEIEGPIFGSLGFK